MPSDRNLPCPCGSGLKLKKCHERPEWKVICRDMMNEKMAELIYQEKIRLGLIEPPEEKRIIEMPSSIII
jgi:hypothetical protein